MPSILFVCTANRFRSPLAEVVFNSKLEGSGLPGTWSVGSAGTWTQAGYPVMQEAFQAASELGLDLSKHRSRLINIDLIKENTLILAMQSGHKEALSIEFPDSVKKIYLLTEVVDEFPFDIPDPYLTGEQPHDVAREVIDLIQNGWQKICQLAERLESERPSI
jgi:protein-tyrosine phosphatase